MRFIPLAPLPLLGLALAIGANLWCTPPARAADKPASPAAKTSKAEEVIAKSIDAMGGEAALNKLKSRVSKGSVAFEVQAIKGSAETYERAPNLRYEKVDIGQIGPQENGSDGKLYWVKDAMGPRILEGEERAMTARMGRFNGVLFWRDYYSGVEFAGEEDINGQACYRLNYTTKEGAKESAWYDKKTYLLAKQAMTITGPVGSIPTEIYPGDYRKVDGILLPFRITQTVEGTPERMVLTFDSIQHNVDIPDERFKLPPEIQELVNHPAAKPKKP